ncbi:MAG: purine-binding chemotaxis protein CheW [Candidatus Omnitrophica bacterium]|nr:purine-binding chemotaxis protein CheW [Flavobacteriales bacterium]MCB9748132.1 purine-binding chemotaxis protein CheW [Candidatus Omnitrophota bacterium]
MTISNEVEDHQIGSKSGEKILELVCFKLAAEEYAVDITQVQEVIRIQRITPIPQMPEFTLGVINIRGTIVPVFDLRRKFQLPTKEFDGLSKILVADIRGTLISFIVDEILDNIRIESSCVDPSPTVKMNIDRDCIIGIGELENRMIIILDLDTVNDLINSEIGTQEPSPVGGEG